MSKPIVIAHRGASGYLPEHTLAAYRRAIELGADYIEPDLVSTGDGVLVARHENEIGETTDVAERAEFAARKARKTIDGAPITGWFTEDFTLAELKTLRAKERIPELRPENARYDGRFEVPTFEEVLRLLAEANRARAVPVGVYPETKHPSYFRDIGLALEAPLVHLLEKHGYGAKAAPAFIQSFEVGNLQMLSRMTAVPLVQLLNDSGQPWDYTLKGDARGYADLAKDAGLAEISTYARGIGPNKRIADAGLVRAAHARGLLVHPWTFRAENNFLPAELRRGTVPEARGDLAAEIRRFLALGIDGLFCDHPDIAVNAR